MGTTPRRSRRAFLRDSAKLGFGLAAMRATGLYPSVAYAAHLEPRWEVTVGSRRQLFLDDFLMGIGDARHDSYPHDIRWSVGTVERSPTESIFLADQPWEDRIMWMCVLYDEGRYRLWYNLHKEFPRVSGEKPQGPCVAYAESDDGISWRKPIFGHVKRYGFEESNIVFKGGPDSWSMELGNVFVDPSAPPAERYKMLYPTWESNYIYGALDGVPYVPEAGVLRGAHSPDGIHWTRYQHIFLGRYTDSQNVATYDPTLGKYVAYVRTMSSHGGLDIGDHPVKATRRGRAIARMESDDYRHWSNPELCFAADLDDGFNVDFYNPAYSRYDGAENAHFMFPSALHHRSGQTPIQVAVSRDNRTWRRPTRETFVPVGAAGSFDDHRIHVAPGILPAGKDHLALYYRAENWPHSGSVDAFRPTDGRHHTTAMGRVLFKRDRIVGVESGAREGTFWTRPLLFEGRRLVVNVEPTGPDPQLKVQLLAVDPESFERYWTDDTPVPGYSFADNLPLTSDELDGVVRWTQGADLGQFAGKPVRLHFLLRDLRLYAFQFVE